MTIEWSDNILIGLPELDDDHKGLIAGMNEIGAALVAGHADAIKLMDAWLALFRRHTHKEEDLLARLYLPAGHAHLVEHAAGHVNFLTRAESFRDQMLAGEACCAEIGRLGDHLMVTEMIRADFDMVGHLRNEGLLLPNGMLRAAE